MNHHNTPPTDLIIALDQFRPDQAFEFVDGLGEVPAIYKVGFELFLSGGPELVREMIHRKKRIFLDLKFHDIPTTVAKAAKQAALMHVEMFTLHLSGGSAMVKAVAQELADIPALKPKILGVTVLTSFDDVRWAEVTRALSGHAVSPAESVHGLIEHAPSWGVDGIVCSAMELEMLRAKFPWSPEGVYAVVPGIRPEGAASDDQARVMTPVQARAAGASAVVMGRPITQASDPQGVVRQTLKDLGH